MWAWQEHGREERPWNESERGGRERGSDEVHERRGEGGEGGLECKGRV